MDAIGEGHHVARCIDRYLRGEKGLQEPKRLPPVELGRDEIEAKLESGEAARRPAGPDPQHPVGRATPELPRGRHHVE